MAAETNLSRFLRVSDASAFILKARPWTSGAARADVFSWTEASDKGLLFGEKADMEELSAVGEQVFDAECILNKRLRKVGNTVKHCNV